MIEVVPEDFTQAVVAGTHNMLTHMRDELPNECVGMLMSDSTVVKLINQARSPSRFEVGLPQMADALAAIDPDTRTVFAIYHSHPNGSLDLSPYDQTSMRDMWTYGGLPIPWIVVTATQSRIWWMDDHYHAFQSSDVETLVA